MNDLLEQLKEKTRVLHRLLEEPEPGLGTWNMMVGRTWKEIHELWVGTEDKKEN